MSHRLQKNLTISKDQEMFIRDNWGKMSRKEIRIRIGITKGKFDANLNIMEGLVFKKTNTKKIHKVIDTGIFDMDNYPDVVFEFQKCVNY